MRKSNTSSTAKIKQYLTDINNLTTALQQKVGPDSPTLAEKARLLHTKVTNKLKETWIGVEDSKNLNSQLHELTEKAKPHLAAAAQNSNLKVHNSFPSKPATVFSNQQKPGGQTNRELMSVANIKKNARNKGGGVGGNRVGPAPDPNAQGASHA